MAVNFKHHLAPAVLAALVATGAVPALAAGDSGKSRVEWDKLSSEQQKSVKAGSPQTKSAVPLTTSHVYVDGLRKSLTVEGSGAQAIFRVEGIATELRHSGRALVETRTPQTLAGLKAMLDGSGLSVIRALNDAGTQWSVQSKSGLEGVEALNLLQESGKVLRASPDWQRDLRTK